MKPPIVVRPLTDDERAALDAGRRSADAFVLRRCQILRARARGEPPLASARALSCDDQTVRNAIHAFNQRGLAALRKGSSRPQTIHAAFDGASAERLRDLLHRSPRDFGQPTSLWTLEVAAEVRVAEGLTPMRVTGETMRATRARLGVRWRRATPWITSPDPRYAPTKGGATG
jgi:Winged helix-turn helix